MTSILDHLTVQLASQIFPRPNNSCLKDGMMWPLVGNAFPRWVMGRLSVVDDCPIWPLVVPTHTLGESRSAFWYGDSGEMYMWVASYSTIPVCDGWGVVAVGVGLLLPRVV